MEDTKRLVGDSGGARSTEAVAGNRQSTLDSLGDQEAAAPEDTLQIAV